MMMPLLGQLTRSWWRVVSAVIVSPHFGCLAATAASLEARSATTAKNTSTATEMSIPRSVCRRSLAGIPSFLVWPRMPCARPSEPTPARCRAQGFRFELRDGLTTARSPPGEFAGIGAGGSRDAAPRGRPLLERNRVHRLRDLVDDQVGELGPLPAVESLHRSDHPDHEERDEQDQADVLDRTLTALALEGGDDP